MTRPTKCPNCKIAWVFDTPTMRKCSNCNYVAAIFLLDLLDEYYNTIEDLGEKSNLSGKETLLLIRARTEVSKMEFGLGVR